MGLPALFRLASGRRPMFVTIDGRLVTDAVAPDGRPNVRVEPHTNHGGTPAKELPSKPWWVEQPDLLQAEVDHMSETFPGFTLRARHGRPTWLGTINTGRGQFIVAIEHRSDRALLPRVEVLKPRRLERKEGGQYRRSEHLYIDDSVC